MPTHRKRSGYRVINRHKRQTFYRTHPKIKKMSPEQEQQLKDTIAFSNSMALQVNERLAAIENRLTYIEGHRDNEGRSDLDKLIENHQQTLKKHEDWLSLCDKAIKELRAGIIKNVTAKAATESIKPKWKFW